MKDPQNTLLGFKKTRLLKKHIWKLSFDLNYILWHNSYLYINTLIIWMTSGKVGWTASRDEWTISMYCLFETFLLNLDFWYVMDLKLWFTKVKMLFIIIRWHLPFHSNWISRIQRSLAEAPWVSIIISLKLTSSELTIIFRWISNFFEFLSLIPIRVIIDGHNP